MERLDIAYYKNFGRVTKLKSGNTVAMITVDVGPRIIYFGTDDMNFFHEDIERNGSNGGEFFDKTYKKGERWYNYGGHRIWKAPEDLWTYFPDNYPISAKVEGDTAVFLPKATKKGLQFSLKTTFFEGSFLVENSVENVGKTEQEIALWTLSVMADGGMAVAPVNNAQTGYLPNKNIVLWPYSDMGDKRFFAGNSLFMLKQSKKHENPFKFGTYLDDYKACYALKNKLMSFQFFPDADIEMLKNGIKIAAENKEKSVAACVFDELKKLDAKKNDAAGSKAKAADKKEADKDAFPFENYSAFNARKYPDFGTNFQMYTNKRMLEMEALSDVRKLQVGEKITISHIWKVYENFAFESTKEADVFKKLKDENIF